MVRKSAGGVVLGAGGTIVLVRNQVSTKWFFPKGGIDEGEDDETAARREIEEEAGLTNLEYLGDLGTYTRPRIHKDGSYDTNEMKEIHMFLFSMDESQTPTASHEIAEVCLAPYMDVAELLEDAKDRVWFMGVFRRIQEGIQRD
jgi:8-oxo-dGTP pyrophosphatase MutT (NUDIX family)